MDRISTNKRKKLMSKVRNKDTDIELILKSKLKSLDIDFQDGAGVEGRPDIVLKDAKIAIFCDGDFWHGRNYRKEEKSYKQFWRKKIKINIERDAKVDKELRKEGWKVLRFWETDIFDNINFCADKIQEEIEIAGEV